MIKVYIASPYTLGLPLENVLRQLRCANELMSLGYSPYVPLLCHFQHAVFPRHYEDWLNHVIGWIPYCDAMIRLPGDSPGADKEVEIAKQYGIPVYLTVKALINDTPEYQTSRSVTK